MQHARILYIAICMMFLAILTNITLFDGEWNGITMWLCTGIFIFASTIFGFSRNKGNKSE